MKNLIKQCRDIFSGGSALNESFLTDVEISNTELLDKSVAEVLMSKNVAFELGHPSTASQAFLITTSDKQLIEDKKFSYIGPDFSEMASGGKYAFAQVIMLAIKEGGEYDPFEIEAAQYLANRLSGYSIRSMPGKLWARISKKQLEKGLNLRRVASALNKVFRTDYPQIEAMEVLFITGDKEQVLKLVSIEEPAAATAREHKKESVKPLADMDCGEMNCKSCDESDTCDDVRDVIKIKRDVTKAKIKG